MNLTQKLSQNQQQPPRNIQVS